MSDKDLTPPGPEQISIDAAMIVQHALGKMGDAASCEKIYESIFGNVDPSKVHLIGPASLKDYEVHINPWTGSHMDMPNFTERALKSMRREDSKILGNFTVDIAESLFEADKFQYLLSCSTYKSREYVHVPMKGEITMRESELITWPMNLKTIIGTIIGSNETISLWYISEKEYNTKVRLWRGVAWALPNMYKDLNVLNVIGVQPEEIYYGSDINLMVDADDYTPKEVDSEC